MVKFFVKRPIAVLLSFLVVVIASLTLARKVPVSLLPDIDVPEIVIRAENANTTALVMEENVIRPIREGLIGLKGMKMIESRSTSHSGTISISFEFGTKMDLAFIAVNEKLDRVLNKLPKDMKRPDVLRRNVSDIPVVRLQLTPKDNLDIKGLGVLTEKVIKKRLEQIEGLSLVEISGIQQKAILITPNTDLLRSMGANTNTILTAVQNANREIGGLNVIDGQYQYMIKLKSTLNEISNLENLLVNISAKLLVPLIKVATIREIEEVSLGYHLFNGKPSIVIAIQKQPNSRMNDLISHIKSETEQFKHDYPKVEFALTQNQTYVLDAGISNLYQDILVGGILTILLLFLVLGNGMSPLLMSLNIPLSVIITCFFFYLFNISFNVISLSGLALGIGMLIDNSIVVMDSINRAKSAGANAFDSAVNGTNEVVVPVISQVLTTVVVYVPIVLFGGVAGALMFDQSIALTISLFVSLVVAFILTPLLYKMLMTKSFKPLKDNTWLYRKVLAGYHKMIDFILDNKVKFICITFLIMTVGIFLGRLLPINSLPAIEQTESLVKISWNEPISVLENLRRSQELIASIQSNCLETEAEVGVTQLSNQLQSNTTGEMQLYYRAEGASKRNDLNKWLSQWILTKYPQADINIIPAPNAFTQLFVSEMPFLEARFKSLNSWSSSDINSRIITLFKKFPSLKYSAGDGMLTEPSVEINIDYTKLENYQIEESQIDQWISQQFGNIRITDIRRFGDITTIRLGTERNKLVDKFQLQVKSINGEWYPVNAFVKMEKTSQPKFITADLNGQYYSVKIVDSDSNFEILKDKFATEAGKVGFTVTFMGTYFERFKQISKLLTIFIIVLILLFIILAIQYENLIQPLIVMLTIPLGISGSVFLLWITNTSFNVIAATGFIIILGLIVDDPILKIEVLNRLEKKYTGEGLDFNDKLLRKMIHEAGQICLKPLLLVSLTTTIAFIPVLIFGGIGNELQRPLALVVIGGLSIGTFFTLWFIPLAYWYSFKIKMYVKSKA